MDSTGRHSPVRERAEAVLAPVIRQVMDTFDMPGLALGIVKDGELAYARSFGVRNRETGEPVTPRSLFHMASVSKPFVATAIMRLVEQGKVGLDAPLVTYLPYFTLRDARVQDITIRQMLCHTSGMPDEDDYRWYAPEDDAGALERYVRGLADASLLFPPGERHAYSNIAYEVLGDVIAKVSGRTFEDYVRQEILAPAGMVDSTFLRGEVAPALAVTPHFGVPATVVPGAYPYHRAHAPSSTLHSSIVDMARWAVLNLDQAELARRGILRAETHAEMWRAQTRVDEDIWTEAFGLGWALGTYRDRLVVNHGGADPGFSTSLVLVPSEAAAVIAMGNAYNPAVWTMSDAALDMLLGLEPEPPRAPVTVELAPALAAGGVEAAAERYHELQAARPDDFDFGDGPFVNITWGPIDMRRAGDVLPWLRLGVALHPDSARLHGLLGAALLQSGDGARAAEHLRRALAGNPDNQQVARLLARLEA